MTCLFILLLAFQEKGNLLDAVIKVDMPQVQALLDSGSDPNIFNTARETPLMLAAKSGNGALIKLLLDRGARPEHLSSGGDTALHFAVRMGRLGAARVLAASGSPLSTRNGRGEWPFQMALVGGDLPMALMLQQSGAGASGGQDELLYQAVQMGQPAMVKLLLDAGLNPNPKGEKRRNPSELARFTLNSRIQEIFRQHKADQPGGEDLYSNLLAPDPARSLALLPEDPSWRDPSGNSALMLAAAYGNPELVTALLDRGAEINARGSDGRTALHEAVYYGRLASALVLLSRGADPNLATESGRATPLSLAFANKDIYSLNYLVAFNALLITLDKAGNQVSLPFKRVRTDLIEEAISQHKPFYRPVAFPLRGVPPEPAGVFAADTPGLEVPVITRKTEAGFRGKEMPQGPTGGTVTLSAIVGSDGKLSDIRVVAPAHGGRYDFEYFAIRALRDWQFQPGRFEGKPVAVVQNFEIFVFRN